MIGRNPRVLGTYALDSGFVEVHVSQRLHFVHRRSRCVEQTRARPSPDQREMPAFVLRIYDADRRPRRRQLLQRNPAAQALEHLDALPQFGRQRVCRHRESRLLQQPGAQVGIPFDQLEQRVLERELLVHVGGATRRVGFGVAGKGTGRRGLE